jgi:serine/threonine protein kinase
MARLVIANPGVRSDYACETKPCGEGGYATVFPATHKPTGTKVALKRLNANIFDEDAQPRMKREVEALLALAGHEHVMPVLDSDPDFTWYVMPLARGDMTKFSVPLPDRTLADALGQAAEGLAHAHAQGFVHRDIKPPNILRLGGASGEVERWVVADWGLVRNPKGMTTRLLTSSGEVIGTDGFIAPEVLQGSHANATAKADVYSLGRVALWAATGTVPLAGSDDLPTGVFRLLVRDSTRADPDRRISLAQFQERLTQLSFEPLPPPVEVAEELAGRARKGDTAAAAELFDLAAGSLDDSDLFLDHLASLPAEAVNAGVAHDPRQAGRLIEPMSSHLSESFGDRNFHYYNVVLDWILKVARAAIRVNDLGLLEDAVTDLFAAEPRYVRYEQRHRTRAWLNGLRGPQARTVARALQASPDAVKWYMDEDWEPDRRADDSIRGALYHGQ